MAERYSRQTVLPEVGEEGQARLAAASVLVVGAGGLGCAVLQYLTAAGVGRLVIVDHDRVEESNLHRQPLYRVSDIGRGKPQAARAALRQLNPGVQIDTVDERLTPANAARLVAAAHVVVDAADSFAVTYVLSDACQRSATALVSASVLGLSGYVGAFCGGAPSYRAVFPELPRTAGSCAESGVLGTAVGVIGTLQAHLTLALLLKLQPGVLGQLISVDFRTLRMGGFSFAGAPEPRGTVIPFIAPGEVSRADIVIDLRSPTEAPGSPFPSALRLAVDALEKAEMCFPPEPRIVLCCR
ncbi:MAG: HesA/MoeB/ThiF family protein, partial [Steroidobacteraceae bacterium]